MDDNKKVDIKWIIVYLSQLSVIAAIIFRAVIDHDWWILFLIFLLITNIEFNGLFGSKRK